MSGVEASIRPYAPGDLDACRGLWRELTQRHRDIYDDPTIGGDDPGTSFDGYFERADLAGVWVVESRGAVVGLTGLLVNGDEAEIEPVVVTASLRSRGIGRRLLERMVREAEARSVRFLGIRPVARNVEAIALFHEAGFRMLGHLDMFMHLGSDEREWRSGISVHGRDFRY